MQLFAPTTSHHGGCLVPGKNMTWMTHEVFFTHVRAWWKCNKSTQGKGNFINEVWGETMHFVNWERRTNLRSWRRYVSCTVNIWSGLFRLLSMWRMPKDRTYKENVSALSVLKYGLKFYTFPLLKFIEGWDANIIVKKVLVPCIKLELYSCWHCVWHWCQQCQDLKILGISKTELFLNCNSINAPHLEVWWMWDLTLL